LCRICLAPPGIQVVDVGQQLGSELAARLGNSARAAYNEALGEPSA